MKNTALIKQADAQAGALTATDLKDWMRSASGRRYMEALSPGELATYALGAGVGGLGAYGLYRLFNRKRHRGKALLWTLLGAGFGAGGAGMYLNTRNPETEMTRSQEMRVNNAVHSDKKFADEYDSRQRDKDAGPLSTVLEFAGDNAYTGVGAGLGYVGGRWVSRNKAQLAADNAANTLARQANAGKGLRYNKLNGPIKGHLPITYGQTTTQKGFVQVPNQAYIKAVRNRGVNRGGVLGLLLGLISGFAADRVTNYINE